MPPGKHTDQNLSGKNISLVRKDTLLKKTFHIMLKEGFWMIEATCKLQNSSNHSINWIVLHNTMAYIFKT
jgi:hypothetical protein